MANAVCTTNPPVRWTPARIRKAIALPKPTGAIDKLFDRPALNPMPAEVDFVLRMLAEADLVDVTTSNAAGVPTRLLLVPVGEAELEWLGSFGARRDDLEDDEREPDQDDEHELGATNSINHEDAWANAHLSDDDDEIDEAGSPDEGPTTSDWALDWLPDLFIASEEA